LQGKSFLLKNTDDACRPTGLPACQPAGPNFL
jgi:hypothetical protein